VKSAYLKNEYKTEHIGNMCFVLYPFIVSNFVSTCIYLLMYKKNHISFITATDGQ